MTLSLCEPLPRTLSFAPTASQALPSKFDPQTSLHRLACPRQERWSLPPALSAAPCRSRQANYRSPHCRMIGLSLRRWTDSWAPDTRAPDLFMATRLRRVRVGIGLRGRLNGLCFRGLSGHRDCSPRTCPPGGGWGKLACCGSVALGGQLQQYKILLQNRNEFDTFMIH